MPQGGKLAGKGVGCNICQARDDADMAMTINLNISLVGRRASAWCEWSRIPGIHIKRLNDYYLGYIILNKIRYDTDTTEGREL